MTLDDQKEQFSIAYARAIASAAGVSVAVPEVDDDSIDLIMSQRETGSAYRSPRLELQLKCTAENAVTVTTTHIHYPLKLKNYNELRPENILVPRILLVVIVPQVPEEWLDWKDSELALRRAGYWLSLKGMPESSNSATVTVRVPLSQPFTMRELQKIMERIGENEPL